MTRTGDLGAGACDGVETAELGRSEPVGFLIGVSLLLMFKGRVPSMKPRKGLEMGVSSCVISRRALIDGVYVFSSLIRNTASLFQW